MYLTAISIIIGLTALYFGSILLMEAYSRKAESKKEGSSVSEDGLETEKLSYLARSNPLRGWV